MAAVRPAGPEPTMTTLASTGPPPVASAVPSPDGRRTLAAVALPAPSSMMVIPGSPANGPVTARSYHGRIPPRSISCDRTGRPKVAHVGDHVPADEVESIQLLDVVQTEDRVLRTGLGPGAHAVHQLGRGDLTICSSG